MPDRHTSNPKTVRMPGGLEAWYRDYADRTGQAVNAAIVKALEEFREHIENEREEHRGAVH